MSRLSAQDFDFATKNSKQAAARFADANRTRRAGLRACTPAPIRSSPARKGFAAPVAAFLFVAVACVAAAAVIVFMRGWKAQCEQVVKQRDELLIERAENVAIIQQFEEELLDVKRENDYKIRIIDQNYVDAIARLRTELGKLKSDNNELLKINGELMNAAHAKPKLRNRIIGWFK